MGSWRFRLGRPYFSVSPIGINGGGSTIPNGGADFGPDTTEGATSPSQLGAPYSSTSGIQEALNTLGSLGGGVAFVKGGSYSISEPIYNTGNNQTIIFDPACKITFSQNTWALHSSSEPAYILVGIGSNNGYGANSQNNGVGNLGTNFSYCQWIGNGAVIDTAGVGYGTNYTNLPASPYGVPVSCLGLDQVGYNDTSPPKSLVKAGHHMVVEGFQLVNVTSAAIYIAANNYIGTSTSPGVSYPYQVRNVRFSRIFATWYPNVVPNQNAGGPQKGPGASGLVIVGSVRQTVIEDSRFDTSGVMKYLYNGNYVGADISNCFITAKAGDNQQIIVRRCTFLQPYFGGSPAKTGSTWELQGQSSGANTQQQRDSHMLLLEDCVFDSGSPSVQVGGSGGGYTNDNDSGGQVGYIWNVEIRRCLLVNAAVNYQASATQFGYIRYADGTIPTMGGSYATGFLSILAGRSPFTDNGINPSVPGSGTAQTVSYGFPVRLIVAGGSPTSPIQINGVSSGVTSGAFVLRSGDSYTLNYGPGGSPTVALQAL